MFTTKNELIVVGLIHCIPPVSDWCSMWYTMCSEGSDPSPKGEQAIGL
ncbi:MAG: hypothetical protein ACOCZQ_01650 [Nanoarchaeota archaeon]